MGEVLLELKNLSVDYKVPGGYLSAVHDLNLTIKKGEFFALVGESGCGKSSVAQVIMRLSLTNNELIQGDILFEGENLARASEKMMEKLILSQN